MSIVYEFSVSEDLVDLPYTTAKRYARDIAREELKTEDFKLELVRKSINRNVRLQYWFRATKKLTEEEELFKAESEVRF